MPNLPYQTSAWALHSKVSREIRFPLAGDLNVLEVEFTYEGPLANYIPAALGTPEPDYSAAGQYLWLTTQGPLQPVGGGAVRYSRTWCSIPPTQYDPDSLLLPRPLIHDLKSGSYYGVSFDREGEKPSSWLFDTRISVSAVGAITPAGATEDITANTLPASTITVGESGGGTTTFSTSDSAATIQAALAAGIGSSVIVAKGDGTIVASGASLATAVKYVSASPESGLGVEYVTDGSSSGTITIRSLNQTVAINPDVPTNVRAITTGSAHGGAAGEWLALWNGDKLVATCKPTAASGSSVTVPADEGPLAIGSIVITHLAFASAADYRIASGPVDCSARLVRRFYLPGVSAGIANMADIPAVVIVTADPVSWFAAVLAYLAAPSEDTYAIHSTERVRRWMGPILEKSALEVQMQDAVKTLSVTA